MTDFNDGEWHIWRGGECPVHPKSTVDLVWPSEISSERSLRSIRKAEKFPWREQDAFMFRVVTPYVEPLERWVIYSRGVPWAHYNNRSDAELDAQRYPKSRIVHMREVLP